MTTTDGTRSVGDVRASNPTLTNGFAVASLILGILWVFWLGSLLAVIFGHVARGQARRYGYPNGNGMALAGLILGYVGVATLALAIANGGAFHFEVNA